MRDVPEGFEVMYRGEYARLARGLASFGDGAEEAVQEAFVKALVRWAHVGTLDDPAGWVRRVAVRQLLNVRRSRSSEAAATARLGRATIESADVRRIDVSNAVSELSPQQRIVVGLRYGGGYPIGDVAATMGLSEGAVKYHLHAARQRLRILVSEDGDG
jgi:RNA polymerase sigma-70 factor (ECF subfamily)